MPAVEPLVFAPLTRGGHPKHMAKRDAVVWDRFVAAHGAAYLGVAYDVAMGGLDPPGDSVLPEEARMWRLNTALRADAILIDAERLTIVEVRPWATVSALGAAVAYLLVAQRDEIHEFPMQAAIVCEGMQTDVRWLCGQLGVTVVTV